MSSLVVNSLSFYLSENYFLKGSRLPIVLSWAVEDILPPLASFIAVEKSVVSLIAIPSWVMHLIRKSTAAAAAKSLQSCPTLCDPIEGSPPGSPIPGILQARTLEWVAISFSNAWKWKVKVKLLSRVRLFATPWTAAHQAPPSMGFSRQEYWSGVPLPSPRKSTRPLFFLKPWGNDPGDLGMTFRERLG